jgi:Peptidoglycan-binding protein, CsiV
MKRPHPCPNRATVIAGLLWTLSCGVVQAEDPATEALAPYLRQAWHDVEVIVFERPGVGDIHAGENLTLTEPRRLPARFLSLASDGWLNSPLPLDDETREAIQTFALGQAKNQAGLQSTNAATVEPAGIAKQSDASTIAEPPPPPTPEEIFRATLKAWEDDVEASTLIARPPEDRALSTAASRLASQGGAHILWHERWTQALTTPGSSIPVLVYGGPLLIDRFQLEGTVDISRTDAIQVRTHVWLNGPNVGREPILVATDASARDAEPDAISLVMDRYLAINEQRTLAPGELTYFDHPRFGVLIRVRPVTPPESVLVAFEAFRTGGDELRD